MHNTVEAIKPISNLCTHVFPGGHVCAAFALRGQAFCYFHHPTRKRVPNPNERRARRIARQSFSLPAPTNHVELQLALNEVILRLAANAIDPRRPPPLRPPDRRPKPQQRTPAQRRPRVPDPEIQRMKASTHPR